MGMYDSLWVECPRCNTQIEFQSKAGDCDLRDYNIQNVPPEIALDCKYDEELCPDCEEYIKLNVQSIVVITPYIK